MPLRLLLMLALCGLLVQPAQAEPVDSLAVEAEPVDSYFLSVSDTRLACTWPIRWRVPSG